MLGLLGWDLVTCVSWMQLEHLHLLIMHCRGTTTDVVGLLLLNQ